MNLQFTKKELTAIVNLASNMIAADGKIDDAELFSFTIEMQRIGVEEYQIKSLMADAQAMQSSEVISVVSNLKTNEKKYVAAFLGYLMSVDGNIDNTEMKLWKFASILCNLPLMNVTKAEQIMNELPNILLTGM